MKRKRERERERERKKTRSDLDNGSPELLIPPASQGFHTCVAIKRETQIYWGHILLHWALVRLFCVHKIQIIPVFRLDWSTWGAPAAQLVLSVQRPCPGCSGSGFHSYMWPFAACHPPPLSLSLSPSLPRFLSLPACPIEWNNHETRNNWKKD